MITIFNSETSIIRSDPTFVGEGYSVAINITGTATVEIINNPFDIIGMDLLLETVTASQHYTIPSNIVLIADITANSGSVDIIIIDDKK